MGGGKWVGAESYGGAFNYEGGSSDHQNPVRLVFDSVAWDHVKWRYFLDLLVVSLANPKSISVAEPRGVGCRRPHQRPRRPPQPRHIGAELAERDRGDLDGVHIL